MKHPTFNDAFLEKEGIDYSSFKERTRQLLEEGKPTSGDAEKMPELLDFTKLNLKRMDRLPKQVEIGHAITEKLLMLPEELTWVVLVEGWCGDVAQNLPIIAKMAELTDHVR
ncbi:MAG: thioredoxin family protein, partial [Flavobacteriales bacterium]